MLETDLAAPRFLVHLQVIHVNGSLTCNETWHLSGIGVVGGSSASCTHVHLESMEGQQVTAVVLELRIHAQQAEIIGEVAKVTGELLLGAVHLAEIQECRQGIDLLPFVWLSAKIVGRVSRSTSGGRPKRRYAAIWGHPGQTGVTRREL